jgi:cysteine-rich repeat protein
MKRLSFVSPAALFLAIGSCTASDDGSVTTVPLSSGSTSGTPSATGPSTATPPGPGSSMPNTPGGTGGSSGDPAPMGGAGPVAPPSGPICGNGTVNVGEDCDDGNMTPGDGCENDCTRTPVMMMPAAVCGNGMAEGAEQCDDGNMTPGDGCENDCTTTAAATCGDGMMDADEECDDGNMTPGDGCEPNCTVTPAAPECGNGMPETGEECDDGNMVGEDGCENDCTATPEAPPVVCGDGMIGEGEECDDGNAEAGDGCENDCTPTPEPMGPPSIGELAPDLDGWLITTPCGDEPSSDDCAGGGWSVNGGPSTACQGGRLEAVVDYDIGGEPGVEYDVAMHFYGVMEPRQYGNGVMREAQGGPSRDEGGTPTPFAWAEGAAPNIAAGDQNYNTYEFHVMNESGEEVRSYYFNADAGTGHYTMAINYEKTLRLVGGGSVSIRVFDNNCRMIKNCGANGGAPCTGKARSIDIAGADPQPGGALQQPGLGRADEHSGQWWLIDVVSVAFVE